jgi:citronellyl-CoA dehydrogenase
MPVIFTAEHEELRRTVRRFVDNEINPHIDEWEAAGIYPAHDVLRRLGELGLLGLNKPVQYGGLELDHSYSVVMAEALGHCKAGGVPMSIGVHTDMATPALARFGSEELCEEFLVPAIKGEYLACLGVSEPGAGSDVASIKTVARRDGDDYVISGTKMWITNGTQADFMCCLANTGEGKPHMNKSLIVVPMKTRGVQVAKKIEKIGMFSSDTAQIFLDEVRVPARYLIGDEGQGFTYQMLQFQEERLWGAANSLTMLDAIIDQTIDYTRTRQVFGGSVLDNQVVHYTLAELKTEVELLRSLVYRATERFVQGDDATMLASMAKLKCGRLSREVADKCLQYWGGMGYTWENPVARAFRDGRLVSIGGGADEVMLAIICKYMGTLPKKKPA